LKSAKLTGLSTFRYILPHKRYPSKVYCVLTKKTLNREKKEIEDHVSGRRYQSLRRNQPISKKRKRSTENQNDNKEEDDSDSDLSDANSLNIDDDLLEYSEKIRKSEVSHSESPLKHKRTKKRRGKLLMNGSQSTVV
jgi:hypothetical protein